MRVFTQNHYKRLDNINRNLYYQEIWESAKCLQCHIYGIVRTYIVSIRISIVATFLVACLKCQLARQWRPTIYIYIYLYITAVEVTSQSVLRVCSSYANSCRYNFGGTNSFLNCLFIHSFTDTWMKQGKIINCRRAVIERWSLWSDLKRNLRGRKGNYTWIKWRQNKTNRKKVIRILAFFFLIFMVFTVCCGRGGKERS